MQTFPDLPANITQANVKAAATNIILNDKRFIHAYPKDKEQGNAHFLPSIFSTKLEVVA